MTPLTKYKIFILKNILNLNITFTHNLKCKNRLVNNPLMRIIMILPDIMIQ